MTSTDLMVQDRGPRFRYLGICWVIYGIARCLAAVWLVSFSNTATVMFGALLSRVPDPFTMMSLFHLFYTVLVVVSVVCGVLGFLAGCALIAGQGVGRNLALIAGFLSLSDLPLGTTLGIYSLIVLLPLNARHTSTVVLRDRTPDFSGHPSQT